MIVSVPFAFQVRSLQGLVKLETELARRTPRKLSSLNHVKSEKLSPCSGGNLRIQTLSLVQRKVLFLETPKTGTVLILLPEINDFCKFDNEAPAPFHSVFRRSKTPLISR